MPTQIQLRRDTAADWTSNNPTLAAGEFGWESDTSKYKIGNGSTAWNSLAYASEINDSITITDNTIKTNVSNANLELSANGSGKVSISGLLYPSSDGSADQVLKTDGSGNLSFVAQSGGVSLATSTNNQVATVTGSNALTGETNLTFDGSTLTLTGSAALDGITVADNTVKANRSNDPILIQGNGTGRVDINDSLANATQWSDWNGNDSRIKLAGFNRSDLSVDADTTDRAYGVGINLENKLTNGSSSNSNFRPRTLVVHSSVDMDGNSYTRSGLTRGPNALNAVANAINNSSSSASTLNSSRGGSIGAVLANYGNPAQNMTQNQAVGVEAYVGVEGNGAGTSTIGTGYGVYSDAYTDKAGGAGTVTDFYAFYTAGQGATNHYAFYSDSDTSESRIGTLERYREKINALTSSSTITVDCGLAPIHKVTLTSNTEFNIANLGTGQTVSIIIVQDSGGSNTATFGTDGSAAVKFAGGTPTLSTAGNAIDICTILNDGTNFYGNIAKAYA